MPNPRPRRLLRGAFAKRVQHHPAAKDKTGFTPGDVIDLIKSLKGNEGVSQKDYEYALTETGFADKSNFDFDEFVEVWRLSGPFGRSR